MEFEKLKISRAGIIPPSLWNRMIDAISAATVTSFVGGSFARSKCGTVLSAKPGGAGAGGAAAIQGFTLVDASERDEEGAITAAKVRVYLSSLAGDLPSGFSSGDDPPYLLGVSDGSKVYAAITVDVSTPELPITSRTLGAGASVPADDDEDGAFYVLIGSIGIDDDVLTPVNARYGPIGATPFRRWFSNPPAFGVEWL